MVVSRSSTSMRDVATLAGVSVGTVSNVLNRPEAVTEATRAKVQAAISKLGWVRNEAARSLRAGRSHSIGLVVMDIANPFFTDLALGVEDVMVQAGYSVLLGNSASQRDREDIHLEQLGRQRVSGVVLAPARRRPPARTRPHAPGVRRRAPQHSPGPGPTRRRHPRGRTLPATRHHRHDPHRTPQYRRRPEIATSLITLPRAKRPTGIFAANDLVAIGLLQGLMTRGIRVPDDIAIVGYDDIEVAEAAAVPLSSIRQPREALGRKAAELLLAEIQDNAEPYGHRHEHARFTPALAARESSLRHRFEAVPTPRASGKNPQRASSAPA